MAIAATTAATSSDFSGPPVRDTSPVDLQLLLFANLQKLRESVLCFLQPLTILHTEQLDSLYLVSSLQGVCDVVGKGLNRLHDFSVIHANAA